MPCISILHRLSFHVQHCIITFFQTAVADLARLEAKYENDIEVARQQRDFKVKEQSYDTEIKTKVATSELAYDLQVAKSKQGIKEEEMGIRIIERTQQIKVEHEV